MFLELPSQPVHKDVDDDIHSLDMMAKNLFSHCQVDCLDSCVMPKVDPGAQSCSLYFIGDRDDERDHCPQAQRAQPAVAGGAVGAAHGVVESSRLARSQALVCSMAREGQSILRMLLPGG